MKLGNSKRGSSNIKEVLMKRQELEKWLVSMGYIKDKFGHYQKTFPSGKTIRMKLSSTHVRRDIKARIIDHNEWLRRGGGYFKDLYITQDGKLGGLK